MSLEAREARMKANAPPSPRRGVIRAWAIVLALVNLLIGPVVAGDDPEPPAAGGAEGSFNALFNGGESGDGRYALWLYDVQGGCPGLRELDRTPLVLAFKVAGNKQKVRDLEYCFAFLDPEGRAFSKCRKGEVSISRAEPNAVLEGRYSLVLQNGEKRRGAFRAAYCRASVQK